jgi:hypothetical protein
VIAADDVDDVVAGVQLLEGGEPLVLSACENGVAGDVEVHRQRWRPRLHHGDHPAGGGPKSAAWAASTPHGNQGPLASQPTRTMLSPRPATRIWSAIERNTWSYLPAATSAGSRCHPR